MSVDPTIKHLLRRVTVVGGLLAVLALAPAAAEAQTGWTDVDGNPDCSAVGSGYQELKIDPVPQGRRAFANGELSGVIEVYGATFDWSSSQGVDAVIVKGGPNARIYRFATEVQSGTGLHAPMNPANGTPYGLSHISFCYDVDQTPPPGPCEPGGPTTRPDGSSCVTPPPGPCEPGGPTMRPDGSSCVTPPPGPCEPGGPATMPDGRPCNTTPTSGTTAGAQSPPQGGVLGTGAGRTPKRVAARARMSGTHHCVTGRFGEVVRGKGIRRVTFFVNGRRLARLRGTRSAYAVHINPGLYSTGVMRITARVEYVAASRKPAETLRATVLSCTPRQAAARPRLGFAG
jgi:hypothetical protein